MSLTAAGWQLAQNSKGNSAGSLLFLLLLGVGFFVIAVLPGRRRLKAAQRVQAALAPGREVMTTAGLYATVVSIDDSEGSVVLQIAPGVEARFARAAIARILDEPTPDDDVDSAEADSAEDGAMTADADD